jgi:hypothetical protein
MTKAKKIKTKVKVNATIESARKCLDEEKNVSPALRSAFMGLLEMVAMLSHHLGVSVNSTNSSKPPSQDPNREKSLERHALESESRADKKGIKEVALSP